MPYSCTQDGIGYATLGKLVSSQIIMLFISRESQTAAIDKRWKSVLDVYEKKRRTDYIYLL